MLAHPQLPPSLIERCLDVLKEIMPSERDLIRVIVEIVVELREGEEDAENADEPPVRNYLYCLVSSLTKIFSFVIDRRQPVRRFSGNYSEGASASA